MEISVWSHISMMSWFNYVAYIIHVQFPKLYSLKRRVRDNETLLSGRTCDTEILISKCYSLKKTPGLLGEMTHSNCRSEKEPGGPCNISCQEARSYPVTNGMMSEGHRSQPKRAAMPTLGRSIIPKNNGSNWLWSTDFFKNTFIFGKHLKAKHK